MSDENNEGEHDYAVKNKRDNDSEGDTNPEKKIRIEVQKKDVCSICLDEYSNEGKHRLCSVDCGHLFGHNCIRKWLSKQKHLKKRCPTCNTKIKMGNIRLVYGNHLVAVDMARIEELRSRLMTARAEKLKLQTEVSRSACCILLYKDEIKQVRLKGRVHEIDKMQVKLMKSVELSTHGNCRVMDYDERNQAIVASVPSSNKVFVGFGIKRVDVNTGSLIGSYVHLHRQATRHLCVQPGSDCVMSCSLDRTVVIFDQKSNRISTKFTSDQPLWSCCWGVSNPNMFFAGQQSGDVVMCDLRRTDTYVSKFELSQKDRCPVVAIASSSHRYNLLVTKLSSGWAYERADPSVNPVRLTSIPGPYTSMRWYEDDCKLLLSMRPSDKYLWGRHNLCSPAAAADMDCAFNSYCEFIGASQQKLMTRSNLIRIQREVLMAAYHETENAVALWNTESGNRIGGIPHKSSVLDICSLSDHDAMATLDDNKVFIYKLTL